MKRRFLSLVSSVLLFSPAAAFGQAQPAPYVSLYIAKVKKEKTPEFVALVKKMVDANRQHKGDSWLASQVVFGEHDTYYFGSLLANQAGIDTSQAAFMGALVKAYGEAGAEKLLQDFSNCLVTSRSELRRLRPNLSRNAPADSAGLLKLVGGSRLVRTMVTRIVPGRTAQYTEAVRTLNEALVKAGSKAVVLESQASAGVSGTVFYSTTFRSSFGGFDPTGQEPLMRQVLGEEGFQKILQSIQETVIGNEVMISAYRPDLSNPPEEVASVDPEFWRPKPKP